MKILLLISSLFIYTSMLRAQTIKVESNQVIITGTNKLGIGVNNPTATLDVNGGIRLGDTNSTLAGLMRFHMGEFQGYDSTTWKSLSTEVDGSITNELQTISKVGTTVTLSNGGGSFIDEVNDADANSLNELITSMSITGSNLEINESGNYKSVSLDNFKGPFERNGTTVRQTGDLSDDFIIGRDELPQTGENFSDNLFFFDKSKGAIRAGRIQISQNWVEDSIGYRSTAFGFNTMAKGGQSIALGTLTQANGANSISCGSYTVAGGSGSMSGGGDTEAKGDYSVALGEHTVSPSFSETAIGCYNTDYIADNTILFDNDDRLFVIGNGNSLLRKDALSLWKNGQLGLGESEPDARLHINANSGEDGLEVYINNKREFYIPANGQVAIGDISNPDAKLYVEGGASEDLLRVRSDGTTKFKINMNGGIRNSNASATFAFQLQNSSVDLTGRAQAYSWNTYSDMRIKSSILPITYGLTEVMNLQPKIYNHHDSEYFEDGRVIMKGSKTTKDIGLLAQEVYEIIPEAVSKPESDDDLWSMDYTRLIPVLIKSIQEQQEMIDMLNDKLNAQQSQIDLLKK